MARAARTLKTLTPEQLAEAREAQEQWDVPREARKVVRKVTEAKIQAACVAWFRGRPGARWARKFSSLAQKSVPDYLFSFSLWDPAKAPNYRFAVEFKKPGEVSKENQWSEQYEMWLAGWDVYECDSLEKFKRIVDAIEAKLVKERPLWMD